MAISSGEGSSYICERKSFCFTMFYPKNPMLPMLIKYIAWSPCFVVAKSCNVWQCLAHVFGFGTYCIQVFHHKSMQISIQTPGLPACGRGQNCSQQQWCNNQSRWFPKITENVSWIWLKLWKHIERTHRFHIYPFMIHLELTMCAL